MEGYGQTELTVAVGTYPWMEPKPGSMGKPSPGYDIDLVDENGTPCEVGEEGQIVIRTDPELPAGMFGGYYRDEKLTAKTWHDGVYYTGDMAWRDEDGYYWFVGRADDVIKSSGYRIGPFEVESALLEHPAVMECAITAVPRPRPRADRQGHGDPDQKIHPVRRARRGTSGACQAGHGPLQISEDHRVRHGASQDDQRQDPPG